jgi:hypothetical protein
MKLNKNTVTALILLISVAACYRLIPNRPAGFAPQMALALFGGAMIRDKIWAVALPVFSLFISDLLYHLLYTSGMSSIRGFYEGQWQVYLCFMVITVFAFLLKRVNFKNVLLFSLSGSVIFFLLSNFLVWFGGGGFARPKTFNGLLTCYNDAILFYRDNGLIRGFEVNFILGDLFFTAVLFGGFYLIRSFFTPGIASPLTINNNG